MTWVRLDDAFDEHPKIVGLSNGAFRSFVRGLCYANRYLTDGRIPKVVGRGWGRLSAAELVRSGLWDETDSGFVVHDFLDYQPAKADVEETRSKKQAAGQAGGQASAAARAQANGKHEGKQIPTPSRTHTKPKPKGENQEQRLRRRDPCFDVMAEWMGVPPGERASRGLAGTIATALADIRRIAPAVTPDEIRRRIGNMPEGWDNPGPMALASHWHALNQRNVHAPRRSRTEEHIDRMAANVIEEVRREGLAGPGRDSDAPNVLPALPNS